MKVFIIAAVLAVAAADSPAPYHPAPAYHQPAPYHPHTQYKEEARPFAFDYAVNDHYTGTNFARNEQSDGHNVQGYYSVVLPDGRTQHVKYTADHYGGYNAEVTYDGYAAYPEQHSAPAYKPAPYHPAPAYKPAPYHPAPAYKPAPYHPAPAYKPAPYHPAPAYKPAPYHPAPAYKPAPYHPAPAYKPAPYHPAPAYAPAPTYAPTPAYDDEH